MVEIYFHDTRMGMGYLRDSRSTECYNSAGVGIVQLRCVGS